MVHPRWRVSWMASLSRDAQSWPGALLVSTSSVARVAFAVDAGDVCLSRDDGMAVGWLLRLRLVLIRVGCPAEHVTAKRTSQGSPYVRRMQMQASWACVLQAVLARQGALAGGDPAARRVFLPVVAHAVP